MISWSRNALTFGILALVTVVVALGWLAAVWIQAQAQIARGRNLYAAHCAACLGQDLQGQPDWQTPKPNGRMPAPPHDAQGHTWHHTDRELLLMTKKGLGAVVPGYESDMPAFEGVLSAAEINAVLAFIKSTWATEARRYEEERNNVEAERTMNKVDNDG